MAGNDTRRYSVCHYRLGTGIHCFTPVPEDWTIMSAHVFPGNVATIAAQIGSSLMPDNQQWMNRFTVKSTSSSSVYTVAQRRSDGVWGCSCRGWTHYRHCKHLTDILFRLARIPTLAVHETPAGDGEISNVIDILASARAAYQEHQR
jgi:hypothetical protein